MKTFEQFVNNKTKFKIGDKVFLYFKKDIYSGNIQFEKGTIRDITYNNNVPNKYFIKLTRFNNSFLTLFINQTKVDIYLDTPENLEKCKQKEKIKQDKIEKNREKFRHIDPYSEEDWLDEKLKINKHLFKKKISYDDIQPGDRVTVKWHKEKFSGIVLDINKNYNCHNNNCVYIKFDDKSKTNNWYHVSHVVDVKKGNRISNPIVDPYGEDNWYYDDIDDTNESVNNNQIIKYTGKVWKNHIAEHFKKNKSLIYTGVGKGGTVFLDYDKMINYLKNDGRKWYIAEIELYDDPLLFEFGNDWMATILVNKKTETGFYPLD